MNNNVSDPFMIGQVTVNPSRNELEVEGKTLSLQPKTLECLYYLACTSYSYRPALAALLWRC